VTRLNQAIIDLQKQLHEETEKARYYEESQSSLSEELETLKKHIEEESYKTKMSGNMHGKIAELKESLEVCEGTKQRYREYIDALKVELEKEKIKLHKEMYNNL
jgi:chromosome segregation ATPase